MIRIRICLSGNNVPYQGSGKLRQASASIDRGLERGYTVGVTHRTAMIDAATATTAPTSEVPVESGDRILMACLKLCVALSDSYKRFNPDGVDKDYAPVFTVEEARKYYKIIMSTTGSRSIHAFVDRDGNVYKPASFKAPAKGVRYNLRDNPEECYQRAEWAGGYLYRARC